MTEFALEDLQHRAKIFEGLNPVNDYLKRTRILPAEFEEHLLVAYGAEAPEHYVEWLGDANNHSQNGFNLSVFEQSLGDGTRQTLHLYAPHSRQIKGFTPRYDTKMVKGVSQVPKSITVRQTLDTFFHYCVSLPDVSVERMSNSVSAPEAIRLRDIDLDSVPLLLNLVQLRPIGHNGVQFSKGPKHPMHVRGIRTTSVSPSREFPVVNLQRPNLQDTVTNGYAIAVHALLNRLVRDLSQQSKIKQHSLRAVNDEQAYMNETATGIIDGISAIAARKSADIIGPHNGKPSIDAIQEMLFGIKMCAGWIATRHTIN